ncbi:MAG TPA: SufD family Fe-S cluster assembly protein, partial [Thermodesulfovibrionia bacterium]|nr:SufD family Fe-S cluster assembly protein [Thermodesulfovibrionia bacterium]
MIQQEDYEMMVTAYQQAGGSPDSFKDQNIAHLVVHQNKILGSNLVKGLHINAEETDSGVNIDLWVEENTRIPFPVHLCFGVLPKEGRQEINIHTLVKTGSEIAILAHCVFPNAVRVQHIMEAETVLEEKAVFHYNEVHYHGLTGGVEVVPHSKVKVGKGAQYSTTFSLVKGRVGRLHIDYLAEVEEDGVMEMVTRVYGHGDDEIKVEERGKLVGRGARGLIKSRIAACERANCEVVNELEALAPDARGHVDCVEVVQGHAKAKAIPLINVQNETAQVTHEAAIGRVNQKELETLMSRGLQQEEAIDVI